MKGKISEIFDSFQGEGLYVGERQIFVRFFGCNLRCKFCDTPLTDFKEYQPQELLEEIKRYGSGYRCVSFTGGEPLLQADFLKEVLPLARQAGFKNYLETNGSLPEQLSRVIDDVDIIAMDLKLPSSTGSLDCWQAHEEFLMTALQKEVFLKLVVCHSTSEKELRRAIALIKRCGKTPVLVLQPNSNELEDLTIKLENFRDLCVLEGIIAGIIPQMHKLVGVR